MRDGGHGLTDPERVDLEPIDLECVLERVHLGGGTHDEAWLQKLIHEHPTILPISDIEPGFGQLLPAAREVPCASGAIDNLYLTPRGEIVLVETKLWQNSEMRRKVVAQALDYVAALTGMSYEAFETAVGKGQMAPKRLYDLLADHADVLPQRDFIDAVSLNLQRGRMLVLIVGDGIRTETAALVALLQSHAGSHFTLALVELAMWMIPGTKDILAVPHTLAQTVMIERGIVRIEQGVITVQPVPEDDRATPQSISMTAFWEDIAKRGAELPAAIRAFLQELEPNGVYTDLKAALTIRANLVDYGKSLGFGYITRNGQFWPALPGWVPEHIWKPYLDSLAAVVGGKVSGNKHVEVNGHAAPFIEQLLPDHQAVFVASVEKVLHDLRTWLEQGEKPKMWSPTEIEGQNQ